VQERLKELVRTQFWEKGIAHMDIRWCNIGWADAGHQHLVLYDLALCKDFKDRSASDDGTPADWAARMDSGSANNLDFICDFADDMIAEWREERRTAAPQGDDARQSAGPATSAGRAETPSAEHTTA
jgi:hypothetical protein